MKGNQSWIMPVALGVALVALLAGALLLYNHFEKQVTNVAADGSPTTTTPAETTSTPSDGTTGEPTVGDSGIPGVSTTAKDAVPDFTMTDANGNPVTLSSFKGMPTIMNFWATWCPPCREELGSFQKMYDQYGTQVNFVMLNVGGRGDTVASVQKFCKDKGYTFPVYFDESNDGTTLFGVTGIPETIFLNAQGLSYGKVVGGMPESMLAQGMGLLMKR
ncbi:MAG: TlpA family protein disulfide reductase [Actinomycetia bacterium]|nr:TlpA family protein disulfide reductase [Actinomycetes bacterium]